MRYNTAEQVPVISTEIPDEHTPLLLDNIPSFTGIYTYIYINIRTE